MTAERWQKVEAIVQSALDIESGAERSRFVSDACAGDEELRGEVERLIVAADDADSFIESPVWTAGDLLDSAVKKSIKNSFVEQPNVGGDSSDGADNFVGRQIGVFELKKELGRGGMGAVYLAERADGEFRQRVAVKLIKRGMDTDFIVKRFRHERQILAALNHPNVARLIDGGTTADGLPYFVMEYVEGATLYRFCDERKLTVGDRLDLFRRICAAVDAAHRIKVVHRDLKPSNILVTGEGAPKLLDFGIAKILDAELASGATLEPTATQMRMMTPEYASPEQVSGLDVTFASDIYSLGVVLYELLTGHRPYRFKSRAPHEIARVICEEEPTPPSAEVTREDNLLPTGAERAATLGDVSASRGAADIAALQKELSGDIEKVVLKCLRKNADERYQSAAELAEDIRRCQSGEAVRAENPILPESPTKILPPADKPIFVRNRKYRIAAAISAILILGAAAAFFMLPPGIVSLQTNFRSEPPRKRSVAVLPLKNETSDAENDFLSDGLSENLILRLSYLPEIKVMSRAAAFKYKGREIAPDEAGREMNAAAVLSGTLSKNNDKIAVFLELLDAADGSLIWSAQYGGKESELVFLQNKMASDVAAKLKIGETGEQKQIAARGYTENSVALENYLKGEFERQKMTADGNRKSIEFYRRALESDSNFALAHQGLALAYRLAPAYRTIAAHEAYPLAKEAALKALAIDPNLGSAHIPLASIKFAYDWDFAGAEAEYQQAIRLVPNNPEAHSSYSTFLVATGRTEQALSELKIAEQFDPQSPSYAANAAWALYVAGRFAEAEAQIKQSLDRDPNFARAYVTLGEIYAEQGKFGEAIETLEKAKQLAPGDYTIEPATARAYAASGRAAAAREIVRMLESKAEKNEFPAFLLADVYANLNEPDKAFYWLERAFDERSNWLVFARVWRGFKFVRNDLRFDDLLKRIGFEIQNK